MARLSIIDGCGAESRRYRCTIDRRIPRAPRGDAPGRIVDPFDVGRCVEGVFGRELLSVDDATEIFLARPVKIFCALAVETVRSCPRRAAAAAGDEGLSSV